MPSTSQLIKHHRRRLEKHQKTSLQRGGFSLALLISIFFFGGVFSLVAFYASTTKNLPSIQSLPSLLNPADGMLMQPTQFYDRTGTHILYTLQNPGINERGYLTINSDVTQTETKANFSEHLITATIAISDPTFWNNPGYSLLGIEKNEHNTIAQRLVSDLLLWDEIPDIKRAVRERILAAQITSEFGRAQVMEWYLNSANYGSFAYGADSAAQIYFGKSASDLNLAEAAILAGVSEAPALNPFSSPQIALQRAEIVIDAMVGQGLINPVEADAAKKMTVTFQEQIPTQNTLAPQFIDLVWQHLSKHVPNERIERGGYKIITSLDYNLQTQVSCTTTAHLSRLNQVDSSEQINSLDITTALETCPASKLLPTLTLEEGIQPEEASASVIVFDPLTSQILALVAEPGGHETNSISDGHPPGSLFTPFVYLTAFTRGFSPASLLWDIPFESTQLPIEKLNPEGVYKGPLRLRNAFATDTLIPAAQLINQIGVENILKIAHQLGLSSLVLENSAESRNNCPGCSLILGDGQITLLDIAQAFGVFSNQGYLVGLPSQTAYNEEVQDLLPVTVLAVMDNTGHTTYEEPKVDLRPVISTQLAYMMTDILSDEAARWPSLNHPNPLEIGRPAGAKIGTTTDGNDLWTVGFTPGIVVGVWVGTPENPDGNHLPQTAASTLWHAVIKYATQDIPPNSWSMPPGITVMDVCDPSGMLPTLQCPNVVSEIFLTGQEPTQPDTLYQVYQVNRETGRLATVFSPPELVEERIYLNIPPEAASWAESIGLEAPPETYDLVNSPTKFPDVAIHSPEMFAYLKGLVPVEGVAQGLDFESYRLQAGEGINPSGWIVVKEETFEPVTSGILGTWDTSGLNGLFALQLIVLRENQRVDTATIQVTLDNEPPQVAITYPDHMEVFQSRTNETITFLVEAADNLGLDRVEYYLNGKLVSTQTQPPYAYPWQSRPGKVTLTVKAFDNAGNTTEAEISFTIK